MFKNDFLTDFLDYKRQGHFDASVLMLKRPKLS